MQKQTDTTYNPMLKGSRWLTTHQAAVSSVLPKGTRRDVISKGSRFANLDWWTLRFFAEAMCKWAEKNKGCVPTRNDIGEWISKAHDHRVPHPMIMIATTPDKLSLRVAMAISGGGYHEGLHTLYSCRRHLTTDEMAAIVLPRWAQIADWSKYLMWLLDWSNFIEDVRIERRGCEEFPGIRPKMADLQDFILDQEEEALAEALREDPKFQRPALSVISGMFRDVGLGYNTSHQREALVDYKKTSPEAVKLVTEGPLRPLVRETVDLTAEDDLGCLRLAMDVMIVLEKLGQKPEDQDQEQQGEQKCPKCGADADKLVVRPKSDGHGGQVKGVGIMTCTECGWQKEVKLQESQGGKGKGKGKSPKFEGFKKQKPQKQDGGGRGKSQGQDGEDSDDKDGKDGEGKGKTGQDDKDQDGKGKGQGEDGEDGEEKDGEDADGKGGDEGDDESDGKGKGKDGEEDGDDSDDSDGDSDGDDGEPGDRTDPGVQNEQSGDTSGTSQEGMDSPYGGGHDDAGENPDSQHDFSDLGQKVQGEAKDGTETGLKGHQEALESAFDHEDDKQLKAEGGVRSGEDRYRPYDPNLDEVKPVGVRGGSKEQDKTKSKNVLVSVKAQVAYLRARLRNIIRAAEMTATIHGVQKGRQISPRTLVDSRVSLTMGQKPMRAYQETDSQIDTSTAVDIVLDESSSMSGKLTDATRMMMAITEPMDSLGCAVQAHGFRDGGRGGGRGGGYGYHHTPDVEGETGDYHRFHGIRHDVFKAFDERFHDVKWRFANTVARGSTPMADGMQFGLDALNSRPEAHRIMFVITDGCPNGGHEPIIMRQIRLANEAGIHVVGVGVGSGTRYVKSLFPDSVQSDDFSQIPKMLVAKLNQIFDVRASKRGRRMRKTS